jgi:uncharacterized membrane protein YhaH (DUF805 family)
MFEPQIIQVKTEVAKSEPSPIHAPRTLYAVLFDLEGRIGRMTYLKYQAGICALFLCISVASIVIGIALLILLLPLTWSTLAVSVKRNHDLNYSGWWLLLWTWLPIIGWTYPIYLLFARGTEGSNKYGDAP